MSKKLFLFGFTFLFAMFLIPFNVFADSFDGTEEDYKKVVDQMKLSKDNYLKLLFPDGVERNVYFAYNAHSYSPESLTGISPSDMNWTSPLYPASVAYKYDIKALKKFYPYFIFREFVSGNKTTLYLNYYKTDDITISEFSNAGNNYNIFVDKNFNSIDSFKRKEIVFENVYMDSESALFIDTLSSEVETSAYGFEEVKAILLEDGSWTIDSSQSSFDVYFSAYASKIISSNLSLKKHGTNEIFENYTKVDFGSSIVDVSGTLGSIHSIVDLVGMIPELFLTLTSAFSLIGIMISTFLVTFPPIITTGLYSIFILGILVLLIKLFT